jgi:hypothetical protein
LTTDAPWNWSAKALVPSPTMSLCTEGGKSHLFALSPLSFSLFAASMSAKDMLDWATSHPFLKVSTAHLLFSSFIFYILNRTNELYIFIYFILFVNF